MLDAQEWVQVVPEVDAPPTAEPLECEDCAAAVIEDVAPPVELVHGIACRESKLMLAGGSKTFKSWTAIDLAVSLATGAPWWGRTTRRARVLYANLELKRDTFVRRLQSVCHRKGVSLEPGWLVHAPLRGKVSCPFLTLDSLTASAEEHAVDVVIIDPTYKLLGTLKENAAEDITRLYNRIDRLTTETKCAVVMTDHFPKGNMAERDPIDRLAGSGAKGRDADSLLVMTRHEQDGCYTVTLIHRELAPVQDFVVEWDFPLMLPRDDMDPAQLKRKEVGSPRKYSNAVILNALEGGKNRAQWISDVRKTPGYEGYTAKTHDRRVTELQSQGSVRYLRNLRYYEPAQSQGTQGT